jgi:hypothetical protein
MGKRKRKLGFGLQDVHRSHGRLWIISSHG